jgi:NAD(P)-dependent dehydrogenase (short-subunit alcohol dehydrogenase family)
MPTRRFTMADQHSFAAVSGDFNPLHLDPIAARRLLLGGVAVHGVHLLLWALDELAEDRKLRGFSRLRAQFERGVVAGDRVEVTWREHQNRMLGVVSGPSGVSARISLVLAECGGGPWGGPVELGPLPCEEHNLESLDGKSGELPLALPPAWATLFPRLAEALPAGIVAALLSTTRLVGMISPGLHSIYSGLDLRCDPAASSGDRLSYRVTRVDPRVRVVEMEVVAGGLRGAVTALVRPKPYAQKTLQELRGVVTAGEFAGQNAIVIGGSRGLGELAAKLLVLGGARVTVTWRTGEQDAMRIVNEAAEQGLDIAARQFAAAAPPLDEPPPAAPFTHLYYCATPRIPPGQPGHFRPAVFADLLETYAAGFARTAQWFASRARSNALIWYPSTVFLDQPDANFAEYAAAKSCGEAICRQLAEAMAPLRFLSDRLPRIATDQTQGLVAGELADGASTLHACLRRAAS